VVTSTESSNTTATQNPPAFVDLTPTRRYRRQLRGILYLPIHSY
jgi:hypothetical protein